MIPSTAQVTLLDGTPLMEAWNCTVCEDLADAKPGVTVTWLVGTLPLPVSETVWRFDASVSLTVT